MVPAAIPFAVGLLKVVSTIVESSVARTLNCERLSFRKEQWSTGVDCTIYSVPREVVDSI